MQITIIWAQNNALTAKKTKEQIKEEVRILKKMNIGKSVVGTNRFF